MNKRRNLWKKKRKGRASQNEKVWRTNESMKEVGSATYKDAEKRDDTATYKNAEKKDGTATYKDAEKAVGAPTYEDAEKEFCMASGHWPPVGMPGKKLARPPMRMPRKKMAHPPLICREKRLHGHL